MFNFKETKYKKTIRKQTNRKNNSWHSVNTNVVSYVYFPILRLHQQFGLNQHQNLDHRNSPRLYVDQESRMLNNTFFSRPAHQHFHYILLKIKK